MIAPMSDAEEQRERPGSSPDTARRKPLPPRVAKLAVGRPVDEVWEDEVGGRTFEVGGAADPYFIKWTPAGSGIDLAVATWSVDWNYGPQWESLLLSAYGIDPDPDRTRYYRLLWDLGP
jgi:aminoglycoside phosphotransferase